MFNGESSVQRDAWASSKCVAPSSCFSVLSGLQATTIYFPTWSTDFFGTSTVVLVDCLQIY